VAVLGKQDEVGRAVGCARRDLELLPEGVSRATGIDDCASLAGNHSRARHVRDLRVVPIGHIVNGEPPVAIDHELLDSWHDLDVAHRKKVQGQPPCRPEVVLERRGRVVHPGEDEALVVRHLRNAHHAVLRLIQVTLVEAV